MMTNFLSQLTSEPMTRPKQQRQTVTENQRVHDEPQGICRSIPESKLDLRLNLVKEVLIRFDNDPEKIISQDVAQDRFRSQACRCAVKGRKIKPQHETK